MKTILTTAAAAAMLASVLPSCTTRAAQLSCDEIARQAQTVSQEQGTPVTAFTDVQEQSATETERQCTATAEVAGGMTATVYLKGYQDANGQQKVAFQETPF